MHKKYLALCLFLIQASFLSGLKPDDPNMTREEREQQRKQASDAQERRLGDLVSFKLCGCDVQYYWNYPQYYRCESCCGCTCKDTLEQATQKASR